MKADRDDYFGSRLKMARKMARFSLQDLADALENVITKQAISKYEQGAMKPTSEILVKLARVLKVKPDFFIKEHTLLFGELSFRKKANLSKIEEESIVEQARDYFERFLEMESIIGSPMEFRNPLADMVISSKQEVEVAAKHLRSTWNLGTDPIAGLIPMLEQKGVKILLLETTDQFDGMAVYTANGNPMVVLNVHDKPIERIRFTIVHELAHILLKFNPILPLTHKENEEYCHFFATCFLIPSEQLKEMIGGNTRTYIQINELIRIKEYYGISIRALVHRLHGLGVINSTYYQRWLIYMSKEYGGRGEPGVYVGLEKPSQFKGLVYMAIAEGLISLSKAATLLNEDINQLRKEE